MRLVAEDLGGERGGQTVFVDVGFVLGGGECLIVTGPNGAGKSTLLRVLAGLLPLAAGSIRIEGGGEEFPSVASACHYLGHLNAMKTALTVRENLGFWQKFSGPSRISIGEALEMADGLEGGALGAQLGEAPGVAGGLGVPGLFAQLRDLGVVGDATKATATARAS